MVSPRLGRSSRIRRFLTKPTTILSTTLFLLAWAYISLLLKNPDDSIAILPRDDHDLREYRHYDPKRKSKHNTGIESESASEGGGNYVHVGGVVRTVEKCTDDQMKTIATQLNFEQCERESALPRSDGAEEESRCGIHQQTKCPLSSWIHELYRTEIELDSKGYSTGVSDDKHDSGRSDEEPGDHFLGMIIGCNKGYDAITTARMGTGNNKFNILQWAKLMELYGMTSGSECELAKLHRFQAINTGGKVAQGELDDGSHKHRHPVSIKPLRRGEIHCIEPMPSTVKSLKKAASKFNLERQGLVVTHAAIGSTDGVAYFPKSTDVTSLGKEEIGLDGCMKGANGDSVQVDTDIKNQCDEVQMMSLQSYAESFIKSKGPINILFIDVEGFDFDILFGAGSVLDRTQYLEFEYSNEGSWRVYHILDAIRLLDGKGFTCYWAGVKKLWRITGCVHKSYNSWHSSSNVACVHRSQIKLSLKMNSVFMNTLEGTS